MSLADSGAAFEQHCKRVSHDGALYNLLVNHRINSLSALAFAVGTPQSPPSEAQFKEFATGINAGTDMTFGELAALRRLHFEASAIVMAKLKSRATDTTESARKLPIAEKIARLQEQEGRLAGLHQGRTPTVVCPHRHDSTDERNKLCYMDCPQQMQ